MEVIPIQLQHQPTPYLNKTYQKRYIYMFCNR